MISIVLVEDHGIVREGIRKVLEACPSFTVLAEAEDGLSAIEAVETHRPEVVVLDLNLPGLHGLEVLRRLKERWPEIRVVVLSRHADESYVIEAIEAGAEAYVLKETVTDTLIEAIRKAAQGERYLGDPLSKEEFDRYRAHAREDPELSEPYRRLTPREREVFHLTVEGGTSREIGDRLSISSRTVEKHQAHIREKLGVRSKAELIEYAHRRGLLDRID